MIEYTIYETASGRILSAGVTSRGDAADPSVVDHKLSVGQSAFIGSELDGEEWWISSGVPALRSTADFSPLSAAITAGDVRTLAGLPDGAVVTVTRPEGGDLTGAVDASGDIAIAFADAGAYCVTVSFAFPFATSEIEIHVNAAS